MDKKIIFGTYLTLFIALISSFDWKTYKLTIITVIFITLIIVFSLILIARYIFKKILMQNELMQIKVLFNKTAALNQVKKIYQYAKTNGGEIYSTHIYPVERLHPDELTPLFDDINEKLEFRKLIYTDDPIILDRCIRETFSIPSDKISVEVLVPSSSFFFPKFVWYILPRVNFISYYCWKTKKSMTSIGLVRIYTKQNTKNEINHISPTIHFYSERSDLFEKIKKYYISFNFGHFWHLKSIKEYEKFKNKILIQKKYKSFLAKLLFLCDNPSFGILHISLFGQYAFYMKGVFDVGNLNVDYNINLIIVCETGKKEDLRNEIQRAMTDIPFENNIIWGPINDEFYGVRNEEVLNIDIELFEENEKYYVKNSLLGFSILPSCLSIFQQNELEHRLHQVLSFPEPADTILKRAQILLDKSQRKAFNDFLFLIEKNKNKYDPKRVIFHLLRNLAWLINGHFEMSYKKTVCLTSLLETEFLLKNLIERDLLNKAQQFLNSEIKLDEFEIHDLVIDIVNTSIKDLQKFCNETINRG